MSVVKTEG